MVLGGKRTRREYRLAASVIAIAGIGFAQTTAQATVPQSPDSTYFKYFFIHVERLQRAADDLDARGASGVKMRNLVRNQARLTGPEFSLIVSIATTCNAAYRTESQRGAAAAKQLLRPYPMQSAVPEPVVRQVNALEAQRRQVIVGCMASLETQMGAARYQTLRNYVVASETPHVLHAGQPTLTPRGKGPAVPAN